MRIYIASLIATTLLVLGACGDDDQAPTTSPGSSTPSGPTLSPLEQKLASVVLQSSDLPEGLEGAPDFTTNEDLAGFDQAELQRLIETGRQLGVDVQFIPTERLEEGTPVRGLQSSASVYTSELGASQTFRQTADEARAVDWAAGYPELGDLEVTEVEQPLADEYLWIRIAGQLECTFIATPTPDAQGVVPTTACEDTKLFVVDEIIFRAGRTRSYLKVTTLLDPNAPRDSYIPVIQSWADLVTQRARTEFPN